MNALYGKHPLAGEITISYFYGVLKVTFVQLLLEISIEIYYTFTEAHFDKYRVMEIHYE